MDLLDIVFILGGIGLAVLTWKAIQRNVRDGASTNGGYGDSNVAWDHSSSDNDSSDSDWGSSD